MTSLASITVATPTVKAFVGTLFKSLSKNLAFAIIVSNGKNHRMNGIIIIDNRIIPFARVLIRVRETKLEPGN